MNPPILTGRHALFLDFDGTLVDLAARPESVRPDPQLVGLLQSMLLLTGGAVALLTGRRLEVVDELLSPLKLPGAGLHGAQRRDQNGSTLNEQGVKVSFVESLTAASTPWAGLWVEDKGSAVAIHYREVPDLGDQALTLLQSAVGDQSDLEIVSGKFVYEARPRGYDKGLALQTLMRSKPFAGRKPVFVGDDRTDEDAIVAAQALGGFGIKVGPGETAAQFHLIDPQAVLIWLRDATQQPHLPIGV